MTLVEAKTNASSTIKSRVSTISKSEELDTALTEIGFVLRLDFAGVFWGAPVGVFREVIFFLG